MKKGFIVSLLMIAVIGYVYFFEFSASKKEKIQSIQRSQLADSKGVKKIIVSVGKEKPIIFVKKKSWWIVDPIEYPAQAGIMEQNLTVMRQILADTYFPLEEDLYGFSKPQASLKLFYDSGEEKNLVLGSKKAPGNNLYILEKKTKRVYVVNNAWGQFFYKDLDDYMVKGVYVNYLDIEKAHFKGRDSKGWEVQRTGKRSWIFAEDQKKTNIEREPIGGLMRPLGKIKVTEVLFENVKADVFYTLSLWLKDGEKLDLGLNREKTMISLPHLKVIAKVDPSSVRYFLNEIRKAAQSGDKDSVTDQD